MSTAVAEPAPASTETATTTPADTYDAGAYFESIKSDAPKAEPEPEPKPQPAAKSPEKPAKEVKGESAKPERVTIPEKLVGDAPDPAPAAAEEDDGLEPPAGISKKGESNWKLMRETIRASKTEIALLKQQHEQLKTATPEVDEKTTEELKTWKQRATDYSDTLKLVAVEKSEDFQKLTGRESKAIERAKATLKEAGADVALAEIGARLPVGRRLKLLAENIEDVDVRHSVSDDLKEVDRIADEKNDLIANSKTKAAEYEATQKATAQKVRDQKLGENSAVFRETFETLQKELKGFRASADGKETQWDAAVDGRIAMFKHIGKLVLSEHMTPEQSSIVSKAIAESLELEVIENDLEYAKDELKKARAELARLKPAQPTAGESGAPFVAANDASQPWNPEAHFERIKAGGS